ncbi:MAG: aspartate kinase [Ignavibacteria bacterium]|nr:aspartate kinase [Ignavibacteria bacterium]
MPKENDLVVLKFGGTSVQDSASINNVINIVKNIKGRKVVVVSAISRATTSLENIAKYASKSKIADSEKLLEETINRHHTIINDLITDQKLKSEAVERIISYHRHIAELIKGLSIINELSLRTLDAFRSFGELMSSTVIFHAMKSAGMDIELIDSRNIIKTNNDFSRAYPDFEISAQNAETILKPLLNGEKIILTQGFIASTEDGITTTMGRESSDFSAAIYGSLLNAGEIQIWTDVDGVLTTDPNIIPHSLKLSEISFKEMEELSNFGAKVLHKNSVKPALKKNIPIKILNSKNTKSSGTIVSSKLSYPKLVKSITYKKNIIVLRVQPKESLGQFIFWEMMLSILSRHKPQIDLFLSSSNSIIIVIAESAYTKIHYDELKSEFSEISDCEIVNEKILITLVGSDLSSIDNFEQRIFISNPGVKADSVLFGYSRHSFSLLIDEKDFVKTMKNLHKEFFEGQLTNNSLFENTLKKKERLMAK